MWLCILFKSLAMKLKRTVYCDGFYHDVKRGISLGCLLSPLMGALYLKQLDDRHVGHALHAGTNTKLPV